MNDEKPNYYRINKVCQKMGLSRSTIYRLVSAGELELKKISARASGITVASLDAYEQKLNASA